jgi:signal transduction histidine kinase
MQELEATQEQLIESEKQKENALIRSRISQDIHDDISAGLTKISWLAESFMAKTAHTNALPDLGILQKINDYSRETVSKLGEIIWSANPERDNLESLLDYIRRYVTNYMEDAAIQYHLAFPNELPNVMLHPALRRNLYLVTKEALHNARKYSNATDIHISFTLHGQQFKLSVQDNGRGMSPNEVQGTGNGLHNMRKRMEAIGGNLSIESIENQGTTLTFTGKLDM